MTSIQTTEEFDVWFAGLRDKVARGRIAARIARLESELHGDVRPVRSGVSEIRVDHGPGYRVYFTQRGAVLIVLLCGGDKSTQDRDIKRAIKLASEIGD